MGSEPNVSVKRSVSIGTMLNFDGDTDGHGDGMCKQTLTSSEWITYWNVSSKFGQ